jgi:outer membrane protein assembly factor BamB
VLTRDCELWFGPADGSKQARLLDLSSGQIRGTDSSAERAAVLTGQPWLEYIGAGWPPRLSQVRSDDRVLYEVTWPAYALHREVLPDGSLVTATTQGHLHCLDADGRPRWNVTRPSRIEALVPFAERGVIAIARKDHFNNYDWQARPVVELIDLQTGRLIQSHHGQANDDYGHLGTDLSLAGDQQRGVLVMGDWAGCLYRIDLD